MLEQAWQDLLHELPYSAAFRVRKRWSEHEDEVVSTHPLWLSDHQLLRVGRPVDDVGTRMGFQGEEATQHAVSVFASFSLVHGCSQVLGRSLVELLQEVGLSIRGVLIVVVVVASQHHVENCRDPA